MVNKLSKNTKNNFFLFIKFIPLFFSLFLVLFYPNFSKKIWDFLDQKNVDIFKNKTLFFHINKEILFFIGLGYLILFFFFWLFKKRKHIFTETDWVREIGVFLLGLSVSLWFYTRVVSVLIFSTMGVLIFYGIYKKQRYKLSKSLIFLLLYVVLQFIGILWNFDAVKTYFPNYSSNITSQLMLLAPIIALTFFRFTAKEQNIFISIVFQFFFLYLILHLTSYLFVANYYDKSLLSCFVFDKKYIDFWQVFQFSEYYHPSLISHFMLIVGAISYISYKKVGNLINKKELIIYWILLLFFIFIVQARVTQIGYFIVVGFIFFFKISENISKKNKLIIIGLGVILFVIGIYGAINYTSIFNDPMRIRTYKAGLESIKENNIFFGAGACSELQIFEPSEILRGRKHFHNDFLQAMVKYGILGLSLLLLWVITTVKSSLKKRDLHLFFFMLPTLLIMMTDSAFNHYMTLIINSLFLFVFLEKRERKEDKMIQL